jgi:cysteinyl-tRNA synthetase
LNFTPDSLPQAGAALRRLRDFCDRLEREEGSSAATPEIEQLIGDARQSFSEAADDDLNIPKALGHLFDFLREMNQALDDEAVSPQDVEATKSLLTEVDSVLGLLATTEEAIPDEVMHLVQQREEARRKKDFTTADQIRSHLLTLGYALDDLREGTRVKRVGRPADAHLPNPPGK